MRCSSSIASSRAVLRISIRPMDAEAVRPWGRAKYPGEYCRGVLNKIRAAHAVDPDDDSRHSPDAAIPSQVFMCLV